VAVHIQFVHQPPYRAGYNAIVIGEFQKGIPLLAVSKIIALSQ